MISELEKSPAVTAETEKIITVVVVEPDKYPEKTIVPATLAAMQNIVGGLIEAVYPFDDEVALVCNEEGKINGLPFNRALYDDDGELYDIISGTFFIAYAPSDSENFESLPDSLADKYISRFMYPEFAYLSA